jgi:hypothetical protein
MASQLATDLDPRRRIERRERLVEQEEPGLEREGAGQRHPLDLAAGELARAHVGAVVEPQARQPLAGDASGISRRDAPAAQAERDVLDHAEMIEEQAILEHDAD